MLQENPEEDLVDAFDSPRQRRMRLLLVLTAFVAAIVFLKAGIESKRDTLVVFVCGSGGTVESDAFLASLKNSAVDLLIHCAAGGPEDPVGLWNSVLDELDVKGGRGTDYYSKFVYVDGRTVKGPLGYNGEDWVADFTDLLQGDVFVVGTHVLPDETSGKPTLAPGVLVMDNAGLEGIRMIGHGSWKDVSTTYQMVGWDTILSCQRGIDWRSPPVGWEASSVYTSPSEVVFIPRNEQQAPTTSVKERVRLNTRDHQPGHYEDSNDGIEDGNDSEDTPSRRSASDKVADLIVWIVLAVFVLVGLVAVIMDRKKAGAAMTKGPEKLLQMVPEAKVGHEDDEDEEEVVHLPSEVPGVEMNKSDPAPAPAQIPVSAAQPVAGNRARGDSTKWSVDEVKQWAERVGLSDDTARSLRKHDVDGEVLFLMTEEEIAQELEISKSDAEALIKEIKKLS